MHGGLNFLQLDSGTDHNCGVTVEGAAYCWGYGAFGMLGNGSEDVPPVPTPVVF